MPRPSKVEVRGRRAILTLAVFAFAMHGCDSNPMSGVRDIHGDPVDPTRDSTAIASVTLFIESGCPISNRYAPEIKSLYQRYAPRGVNFWLVYPDAGTSAQAIR